MRDLKVIFMGTPEFSVPVLKYLIDNTNVVLVVTQPDKVSGRNQEMICSPVKKIAIENNIDVFQPIRIKKDFEIISEINPDIIITCAYGQIIPQNILDIPKMGCINVHASLLPKYRGAAPIQWALLNGEKETGVTLMYMDANMDTGDMIEAMKIKINNDDNVGTLHDKLSLIGVKLLEKNLPKIINGTNNREKQNNEIATLAPMIKREDEKLDFNDYGNNIIDKIRAFNPWPLAYFILNDKSIKVLEAKFVSQKEVKPSCVIIEKKKIGITCNDGIIYLEKIKPEGKKVMDIASFVNGASNIKEWYVS